MRRVLIAILALGMGLGLLVYGCAAKTTVSSNEAIAKSKTMQTVQQKVDYLISQANVLYSSKQFQEAINTAQYVLSYLDKNSTQAKNLIEKAKAELAKLGQQKLNELKGKVGLGQ